MKKQHIAALAFPFGTHAAPLLCLIKRLSEALPDVNFSFFGTQQSNHSLFGKNDTVDNIKPYNVDAGLPEGYEFKGNRVEPIEYFLKATPGNFKKAMEEAVAETGMEISCLITDAFFWFSAEMAEAMHVPWIAFWTAGPRSLLLHIETDNLREQLGINGPGEKTLDFLPGFDAVRSMDVMDGVISGDIDSPFSIMLHKMGEMLPIASAVAINSFEDLDLVALNTLNSKIKNFLNIGPFALTSPTPSVSDPHGCLQWLDNHKTSSSVAYISFGSSMISPPPPELLAFAEALEESGTPFLWSFRGNVEEQLSKGFLERTKDNGKIVPWAPQSEVLAHSSVGVFVTHCGWNSILDSIIGGVPMICRPFFGDQGLNQRTIEVVWKIGLGVEYGKFTKDGTVKALEVILSSEEGRLMRGNIKALGELAVKAVQNDGSSTVKFKALLDIFRNSS